MFQKVDRPTMFPAVTLLGNTGGPVVEISVDHPGGCVYVDATEAAEIARHFDFASPAQVKQWTARIEALEAELEAAEAKLRAVRAAVNDAIA